MDDVATTATGNQATSTSARTTTGAAAAAAAAAAPLPLLLPPRLPLLLEKLDGTFFPAYFHQ